jgi:NADH-quinone oxidoreductase subunit L
MFDIKTLLILIPALPLAAALVTAALGSRVLRTRSHMPTVTAFLLSFVASILLVFQVQQQIERQDDATRQGGYEQIITLWTWANLPSLDQPSVGARRGAGGEDEENASGQWPVVRDPSSIHHSAFSIQHSSSNPQSLIPNPSTSIDIALRADPLTATMLAIVTCISSLVAIYSIGYMQGDRGYWRFFTYISLFVFAMTMLVSASNFVLLFVFWEMVGLCSYLLIGFWYEKPAAAAAGKKAFLVNRIGDCGFLLGVFLIWTTYGTLDFTKTFASASHSAGGWTTTAICLLLMFGACGKSAQFPLHVWLPDAMEGPTPVSALMHAATMVTAGVYMVVRCMPLFGASTDAQHVVALIGGGTALLGGIIAITQTDLKRILAYSTISHLGYMFLALGTGTLIGATAGMFHLLTHAFFKALLFLGAGSVMHAMGGVIDIRQLGGLRHRMPATHWTFLFGCLAIAGVAPFAGFWSKDAILLAVREKAAQGDWAEMYEMLFATAAFGILLIDFYMFRPFFMVFYGPERIPPEAGHHAHESPGAMTGPLVVLAFGSLTVGAYFEWTHGFANFLKATPSLAWLETTAVAVPSAEHARIGWMSTGFTLVGITLAALVYLGNRNRAARLARLMNVFGLYTLSYGKFFFDAIYLAFVVWPLLGLARMAAWFDTYLVDGLVDLVGGVPKSLGAAMRPIQNGLVQFYALAMMLGLLILLGTLLMS